MGNNKVNEEQTGLPEETLQKIRHELNQFSEIEKACVFGSRAKGNFKSGSDIDIALFGGGISYKILKEVTYQLNEETTIPYFFDLVHYENINNNALITHINEFGLRL